MTFTDNEIWKNIKDLDPDNAHSHYLMSIHMLKTHGSSISKTLFLIFRASLVPL